MSTELTKQETEPKITPTYRRPYYTIDSNKNHYVVEVFMPGVSKGDYSVSLHQNELLVEGKKVLPLPTNARWLHREITPESYKLQLQLNIDVDADGIKATSEDGILNISLPVAKKARPRLIKIQ